MAVSGLQFSATVGAWARKSEARMRAIFRESAQRTVSYAQERIPVDTGFARASVRASLASMPPINKGFVGEKGATYSPNAGFVTGVIASAGIGQTIHVGWTAAYVLALEYGHSRQAPSGFVRLAAQRWPQTVRAVTAEARQRSGS